MSNNTLRFLRDWVSNNVHPVGYDNDNKEARRLAAQCMADAEQNGISAADVESAAGIELVSYMSEAIENVVDGEVDRLVSKDKS
jgi:hypothetical protein